MRRFLVFIPLAVVLVACSGTENFKSQTETFLNDTTEVEANMGGDVENAECEEPADTEIGTRYICTADVAGVPTSFVAEIIAENEFRVAPEE